MSVPTFHSYQGQDRFILQACGAQRGGFFIDSGASDGVLGSNTKLFEDHFGWTGICIEPNDAMYSALSRNRTCVCLNCCVYDRDGEVEFFEEAEVYGGILEEYDPGHLAFARRFVATKPESSASLVATVKPARTMASILREYRAPRVIDYWSLDTEGSELAILRSFPFDEYRVRFLTVEHNNTPVRAQLAALLRERGFARIGVLGIDDVWAWSSGSLLPSHSRVWSASRRL